MSGIFHPVDWQSFLACPSAIIALCRTRLIFFSADENRRASDLVGQICLHCFCEHFKAVACQLAILLSGVCIHKTLHQRLSIFRYRASFYSGFFQFSPRVSTIHWFSPLQKPNLNAGNIFPFERRRIYLNKTGCHARKLLQKALCYIAAH